MPGPKVDEEETAAGKDIFLCRWSLEFTVLLMGVALLILVSGLELAATLESKAEVFAALVLLIPPPPSIKLVN